MRTFREGLFSSLITRLTLAVLALLLLSLGVTTAVFIALSRSSERFAAIDILVRNETTVHGKVIDSLLSFSKDRPLAHIGSLPPGVDRVLLTRWGSRRVYDTAANGGPSASFPSLPITYHGHPRDSGVLTATGDTYAYVVQWYQSSDATTSNAPSYRNIIMLRRLATLPEQIGSVVRQLWAPGAVALLISSLVALAVLRTMTRRLHAMTHASESMARGDYDQRVDGDGSDDEIGQLARSFNHMAYEVKRAREMQRQFVANVSHDLRSPLTSIIGFSQILAEDPTVSPGSRRAAEIINSEAERLHRLTMDLLDLSRLESGRLPLSRHPLDLNAVLREVAARYHVLPNTRGVRFTDRLCDEPLPIVGDPDRLTQVVVNLLDNALKFCHAEGEVRLISARQEGRASVEIYNTGSGIAPDDLPRVFDRFYRGDHSRAQQTGGSGIGLAIVRELVHAHGGEVTATSTLGAWTAMTIRLPLACDVPRPSQFTKDLQSANTGAIEGRL